MTWKPDYNITPQRIVCAACKHKDGMIVLGVRHFDSFTHATLDLRKQIDPSENWQACEQGFVDQFGQFLSRTESWVIACAANQIHRLVGGQVINDIGVEGTRLYSENLY